MVTFGVGDSSTGKSAAVDATGGEVRALVVAQRALKNYQWAQRYLTNPTYGAEMAQNVTFGGAPEGVHDGTDTAWWTGSAIVGTWTFNSAAQAHGGTKSVDATATVGGDIAQFLRGAGAVALSGYTALTGWLFVTAWDTRGTKEIRLQGWDSTTGTAVGTSVVLGSYIDTTVLNSWQEFVIPLTDMSLEAASIDAFRLTNVDVGPGVAPTYYLDDFQIEQTGTPAAFSVEPEQGTWWYIDELAIFIVDAHTGGLAYNKILSQAALSAGLGLRQVGENGGTRIIFSYNLKTLQDFLTLSGCRVVSSSGDGVNAYLALKVELGHAWVLKAEEDHRLELTVSEDLSGLVSLKMAVTYREESRE